MSIPPEHEAPTDDLPDSLGEDPQVEAPADTSGREPAPEGPVGVEQGSISDDEAEMLDESAQELTPIKNLARATEHTKFIITTVGTIGTLLAGAGGVTAAVALNRTTVYWQGIPVVPVGALLTSVFAGLSVGIALWGRRPSFTVGNAQRLEDVKAWFEAEIGRKKRPIRWSSRMFMAAAFSAVATSAVAGLLVITNPVERPRNLASFSTTVAGKGEVTIHLSGAVDGLENDATLIVTVTSNAPGQDEASQPDQFIHLEVRPDADGKAALDSEAQAPVGSTQVTATLRVIGGDDGGSDDDHAWTLGASYPEVPAADATETSPTDQIAAVTPAAIALLADYLTRHGGEVPARLREALTNIDIGAWVKAQQELLSTNQLGPRQTARLSTITEWQNTDRQEARFRRHVGALFVWGRQHNNKLPGPNVQVDGRPLGVWVSRQRQLYASKKLDQTQIALLEAVPGWTW